MAATNMQMGSPSAFLSIRFILFCCFCCGVGPEHGLIQQWRGRKFFGFEAPVDAGAKDDSVTVSRRCLLPAKLDPRPTKVSKNNGSESGESNPKPTRYKA